MGVSFSSAVWSPSLQARSSVLMSFTADSPGSPRVLGRIIPTQGPLATMIRLARILRLTERTRKRRRKRMKKIHVVGCFIALLTVGSLANAEDRSEEAMVKRGFEIAPVPLNLAGKNYELVGLGSYLVNAAESCNDCHTSGGPPNFNYASGGNPYFNQPQKVDPTVYLSGGSDFGPVGTPTGPSMYQGPDMIARNLTPDKT